MKPARSRLLGQKPIFFLKAFEFNFSEYTSQLLSSVSLSLTQRKDCVASRKFSFFLLLSVNPYAYSDRMYTPISN